MGKVKLKKKSTFIDMTAMSDVTVLLLTFFMLTSTFLQKEPTIVYTPSSVSEEKVPVSNLMTVLISAADKSPNAKNPTDTEGKIFISFAGDSTLSGEEIRGRVLDKAVEIYNSEQKSKSKQIQITPAMRKAFTETNMMGAPFKDLPEILSMPMDKRDKLMSELGNPKVGIPINGNKDKNGDLNDFQIWCKALYIVAKDSHDNYAQEKSLSPEAALALSDLYTGVAKDGKGIAIKADKDTPFTVVQMVFDNLQTMSLNKFSLMTALTSEEEISSTPN